MKTANAFKISAHCWRLILKTLMVQIVVMAVAVALCFVFFSDLVGTVVEIWEELNLVGFLTDTIESIAEGTFSGHMFALELDLLIEKFTDAIESMPSLFNRIEWAYIGLISTLCIYRVMNSSADTTVAFSLNEFMTTNSKRPFIWYFFKKMNVSLRFVLLQFVIAFPLDLVIIFSVAGVYLLFLVTFGWWTILPTVLIAVGMYSVRTTLFAFWLPSIAANNDGAVSGLQNGFSKLPGHFWSVFLQTFVTIFVMAAVLVLSAYYLPNIAGSIISAVVSLVGFFFIKCFNIVQYYEAQKIPYFSTKVDVAGTNSKDSRGKIVL